MCFGVVKGIIGRCYHQLLSKLDKMGHDADFVGAACCGSESLSVLMKSPHCHLVVKLWEFRGI